MMDDENITDETNERSCNFLGYADAKIGTVAPTLERILGAGDRS